MQSDGTGTRQAASIVHSDETVEQVLLAYPPTASVFNAFGIDVCCGGGASLAAAAERDGIDLELLLASLDRVAIGDRDARSR